jgi:DNA-binding MarR family transcriptional regulator
MPPETNKGSTPSSDYSSVDVPPQAPEEYTYVERRAELLDIIEAKGHPEAVNQAELAARYDVSPSTISRDIDRLADHVHERLADRERRALVVDSVVQHSVRELVEDGEHRAAVKSVLEWEEWAAGFHDLEELHERLERLEREDTL